MTFFFQWMGVEILKPKKGIYPSKKCSTRLRGVNKGLLKRSDACVYENIYFFKTFYAIRESGVPADDAGVA